jgi:Fic family protein
VSSPSTPRRGKTTPASNAGSYAAYAHGLPDVDLVSDEASADDNVLSIPTKDNASALSLSNEQGETTEAAGGDMGLSLGWEDRIWRSGSLSGYARAQRSVDGRAYRAAVPSQIARLTFDLDPAVAAESEDARAEITRFDAELSRDFDGEFAPMASVLLRTESASSSQIENITAGARALSLAELGLTKYGSNAKLVLANVEAMNRALATPASPGETLTREAILAIHEALMVGQDHADPGRFRTQQVWIGGKDYSPHEAAFVPPHHERVEQAITDLCSFAGRTDMPLVAQAAIAHAQFETIHPFNDGNGRTGRALVHVMLRDAGATTRATVPVSSGLLTNPQTYFEALTAYREGDPNPIISRFSQASFAAVENGRTLAHDLSALRTRWNQSLTARRDSVAWRILPLLFTQPSVTSNLIQERMRVSQPAADRAIRQLQDAGILSKPKTEHGEGAKRNVVWHSPAVLEALDAFGERARRGRGRLG